jgi:hypothetical protein
MTYQDQPLNIPGGTYTPTQTCFVTDVTGQQWATSMSDARLRPKVFGIHVWYRKTATAPWQILFALEECHGWLSVDRGQLQFIYNRPKMAGAVRRIIPGYVARVKAQS